MTVLVGEAAVARYVKHPPPGASAPLANGMPLDAGTLCLTSSNISWMARESCRQIVNNPGFQLRTFTAGGLQYAGNSDVPSNTDSTGKLWQILPWGDHRTTRQCGPIVGIADQDNGSGGATLRPVRVVAHATISATATFAVMYCGMVTQEAGSALFGGSFLDFQSVNLTLNASAQASLDLIPLTIAPMGGLTSWTCRSVATASLGNQVRVTPYWIWIGVLVIDPSAGNSYLNSYSAFEIRL